MTKFIKTTAISSVALMMLAATAPASFATDTLEIKDFIGTINWSNGPMFVGIQENEGDTKVSGQSSKTVDGGQSDIDGSDCKSSYGRYNLDWFGKKKEGRFGGFDDLEDLPVLDISFPEDTKLILRNSIIFTDGSPDVREADLELRHCGDVNLGNVSGLLAVDGRGSADVKVGETGQIVASVKGSGDLSGGDSGEVLIKSHGSGDIDLASVISIEASLHGSGDLFAEDVGGDVDITSHGSGDTDLEDIGGSLAYSGHGSGDLSVGSVRGESLDLQSYGSGDIDIDDGDVEILTAIVRGSATVDYSGVAEAAKLKASGSGDITIHRVTGVAEMKSSGSGDIDIYKRD